MEYGQISYTTVYVNVDGKAYELKADPDAVHSGVEGVSRMELTGRRAIVAGEVVDGVYTATYAELLPVVEAKGTPAVQEMLARRKVLEAELLALDGKHMRLMAEQDTLDGIIQAESEIPTGENEENRTLMKEDFLNRENEVEVLLTSIEAQISAVESQIDLVDREIIEASEGY